MAYLISFNCKKNYYLKNINNIEYLENLLLFKKKVKFVYKTYLVNKEKYKHIIYDIIFKKTYNKNLLQIISLCYDWHEKILLESDSISQISIKACEKIILDTPSEIIIETIKEQNYLELKKYFMIDIYFSLSNLKYLTKKEQNYLHELKYYGINLLASDETKIQVRLNYQNFYFKLCKHEDMIVILRKFMKIKKIL